LDLAEEIGETHSVIFAHIAIALICFHRDDLARADEAVQTAYRELIGRGFRYRTDWAA